MHCITALQNEYSLWTRDPEDGALAACHELEVGFVAYRPLGRGALTGKITKLENLARDDFRRANPRFDGGNLNKNLPLIDHLSKMAMEKGSTPGHLALACVLAQGEDIVPIFGTKRRTYLEENIRSLGVSLTVEDWKRLDDLIPKGAAAGTRYGRDMMTLIGKAT